MTTLSATTKIVWHLPCIEAKLADPNALVEIMVIAVNDRGGPG